MICPASSPTPGAATFSSWEAACTIAIRALFASCAITAVVSPASSWSTTRSVQHWRTSRSASTTRTVARSAGAIVGDSESGSSRLDHSTVKDCGPMVTKMHCLAEPSSATERPLAVRASTSAACSAAVVVRSTTVRFFMAPVWGSTGEPAARSAPDQGANRARSRRALRARPLPGRSGAHHGDPTMVFASRVAAVCASSLPVREAFVSSAIAVWQRTVPSSCAVVPTVAPPLTCQKTF